MPPDTYEILPPLKGAEQDNPNLEVLPELPAPGNLEVAAGIPTRTGLSFIKAGGGIMEGIGDLIRNDSISTLGAQIYRNAAGAEADSTPEGMNLGQQVVSSGLESALQMAPAMLLAPESLAAAGIGTAATQQAGERYGELRDKGFSGGMAGFHAGIDGLAEGLGEAVSLPVLAKSTKPFLDKFVHFVNRELVGEEFTTVMQQANAMLSDQPDMTWQQFLQGMAMTAAVTPVAAFAQTVMAHGAGQVKDALTPSPVAPPAPAPLLLPAPKTDPVPPGPDQTLRPPPVSPGPVAEGPPNNPPADLPPNQAATPPANPAPTPESHEVEKLKIAGFDKQSIPLPDGSTQDTYVHVLTGLQVSQMPGGWWQLSAVNPDTGAPIALFQAPTAFGITDYVSRRGYNTDLGVDWKWSPDFSHITFAPNSQDGWGQGYTLNRSAYGWELYAPNGNHVKTFGGKTLEEVVGESGAVQYIPSGKAPPPNAHVPGMFQQTPDEMLQNGTIDPELYHGFVTTKNSKIRSYVEKTQNGYDVKFTHDNGQQETRRDLSHADALDVLHAGTGLDLRKGGDHMERLYDEALLNKLLTAPKTSYQFSANVANRFGGVDILKGIQQAARVRQLDTNLDNAGWRDFSGGLTNTISDRHGEMYNHKGVWIKLHTGEHGNLHTIKPGVYFQKEDHAKNPVLLRVAGYVEQLRKLVMPNAKIALGILPTTGPNNGMAGRLGPSMFSISLRLDGDMARIFKTVIHEFGHLTVFEHLTRASPKVKATLMRSYLQYTKDVNEDTALHDYLLQHHLTVRKVSPFSSLADTNPKFAQYVMSFSEYLADQSAGYLALRQEATIPKDPEVRTWFDGLIAQLHDLWHKAQLKFRLNEDWAKFLDGVIGGRKAGTQGPRTASAPPIDTDGILPKVAPTRIDNDLQAQMLADRASRMLDAFYKAGIPKTEVDKISPTGLIGDINWDAAKLLSDSYGVKPETWWGNPNPGSVDDTTSFREQLNFGANAMEDKEVRDMLGASAKSVKAFNWLMQRTMTAVQLRKRFGQIVPGVKTFVDTLEKMYAYRSRWKEIADNRIKEMRTTGREQREKVFSLLLEEDKLSKYMSVVGRDAKGNRTFTLAADTIKKFGLNEQGIKLYQDMRTDFENSLAEMEEQSVQELYRLYGTNSPALVKAEAELRDGFDQMRARPYVPHTRFGDHTVAVRKNGVLIEFYQVESERAAKKLEGQLRSEHGRDAMVSRGVMTDQMKLMMGLPPQLINAMKAQLNLSGEQIGKFEDILKDMSNGASFVRRFKRRKNIAGWEDDAEMMPRAYADYMSRFANHISRIRFNHQLTGAVGDVRIQANTDARNGVNTVELNNLSNWLTQLQDYVNNPGTEFANARAAATIWYLGLNVKSALNNALSVPMVTLPYLGGRYGDVRSVAAITQAYKDVAAMFGKVNSLTDDEKKMLEYLRSIGKIDQSFAMEVAGVREGGRLVDQTALSKPLGLAFGIKYWAMLPFQKMEVVNRQVTALAAYRLERKSKQFDPSDPMGFDKGAADFAGHAIQDTQSENAQWNRAPLMRGKKSVLTMFMSYNQNIIYQMYGGDQSWMRLLAVQLMAAGLMGLPFAQDADDLIKFLSRHVFGTDMSASMALKAYFKDTIGSDWALQGMAHNLNGIDISGSLSQGKVIPGLDALTMEGQFADRLSSAAGDVGGAGFSIIMQMMKAVASNDPDQIRRFNHAFPEFARSMIEGGNMLASGQALDGKGNELAQVTQQEALARMAGFQVTDVTKERAKRFAEKDSAQYWLTRRAYVMAIYQRAVQSHDSDWLAKANDALRDFNSSAPDAGLKITSAQVRESIKSAAMNKYRAEQNLGPGKTTQGTYQRIGELNQ